MVKRKGKGLGVSLELTSHKFIYVLLFILLLCATFLRIYRVNEILGFYFDQGRDALVVADLLEKGKFFLIGPTTGIAGIFRGPFYYYLITPFYWVGQGNPIYPAIFLALTSVSALVFLFYLGKEMSGRTAGLFAVALATSSFYVVKASRWLSNPTPMLLLSMLLLTCMVLIQKGYKWAWVALAFIAGSSLFHFGSSGEFFYFPALFVFSLWQFGVFKRKLRLPEVKIIFLSLLAFVITAAPLAIFDLRHEQILSNNILKFFGSDQSFKVNFWDVFSERIGFVSEVFYKLLFLSQNTLEKGLMSLALLAIAFRLPKLLKDPYFSSLLLLLVSPVVGLLFFQGNEGNIYDYYLTGYFLPFVLFVAIGLREILRVQFLGIVVVTIFLFVSIRQNILPTWSSIYQKNNEPTTIEFSNQKEALNWIYLDANGGDFNIDAYVPPVIPHTYDYLFRWYETSGKGTGMRTTHVSRLYTLYEEDPPHPERLNAWLDRQQGIGKVVYEHKFRGITVQRRERFIVP